MSRMRKRILVVDCHDEDGGAARQTMLAQALRRYLDHDVVEMSLSAAPKDVGHLLVDLAVVAVPQDGMYYGAFDNLLNRLKRIRGGNGIPLITHGTQPASCFTTGVAGLMNQTIAKYVRRPQQTGRLSEWLMLAHEVNQQLPPNTRL